MREDIRRAKKILESKGYSIQKKLVFEGLDESVGTPLFEFLEKNHNDYSWEVEDSLCEGREGCQLTQYEIGDIIMPMKDRVKSPNSGKYLDPHKILIIYSKREGPTGTINYKGFVLSSKAKEKANIYNEKFPDNIYIKNYQSILYRGRDIDTKECFLRVDDVVTFTNDDVDVRGVWKGTVSNKFLRFIKNCYDNYKNGISNANKYWLGERSYSNYGRDHQEIR